MTRGAGEWFWGAGYGHAGPEPRADPIVALMLVLATAAVARLAKKCFDRFRASRSSRGRPEESLAVGDTQAYLRGLQRVDPRFDAESFLERAEMIYVLLARARNTQTTADITLLLMPRLAAAYNAEIAALRERRRAVRIDDLRLHRSSLESVRMRPNRDQIIVHFDATYAPVTLDADTGKPIGGFGHIGRFGERWTFVRSAGTQTPLNGGVVMKLCARCGAPLTAANYGICPHCDAKVSLGEIDWTVERIEKASFETKDRFRSVVERAGFEHGVQAIGTSDPHFLPARFLERVKLMYLAVQDARRSRDLEKGCAYMSQMLYVMWSAQIEAMISGGRVNVVEQLSIDHLTPLYVERGLLFDLITVLIDVRSVDYEADEISGKILLGGRRPRRSKERWTFKRSVGAATVARGIAEAACPRCGADLAVNNIGVCRHCDVVITNGRFDWVVSRITRDDLANPVGDLLAEFTPFADMASIRDAAEPGLTNTIDPLL